MERPRVIPDSSVRGLSGQKVIQGFHRVIGCRPVDGKGRRSVESLVIPHGGGPGDRAGCRRLMGTVPSQQGSGQGNGEHGGEGQGLPGLEDDPMDEPVHRAPPGCAGRVGDDPLFQAAMERFIRRNAWESFGGLGLLPAQLGHLVPILAATGTDPEMNAQFRGAVGIQDIERQPGQGLLMMSAGFHRHSVRDSGCGCGRRPCRSFCGAVPRHGTDAT